MIVEEAIKAENNRHERDLALIKRLARFQDDVWFIEDGCVFCYPRNFACNMVLLTQFSIAYGNSGLYSYYMIYNGYLRLTYSFDGFNLNLDCTDGEETLKKKICARSLERKIDHDTVTCTTTANAHGAR